MNKKILSLFVAAALLSAGAASAQTPPANGEETVKTADGSKPEFARKHHKKMAKRLARELGLTPQQQEQADKIRRQGREKIKPLMDEMKTLREKIDRERRQNMEEFEKILTSEQKDLFDEIKHRGPDFRPRPPFGPRHGEGPRHMRPMPPEHMPLPPAGEMLPPPPAEGMAPMPPHMRGDMMIPPHEGMHPDRRMGRRHHKMKGRRNPAADDLAAVGPQAETVPPAVEGNTAGNVPA